jgi:hypothetical protein
MSGPQPLLVAIVFLVEVALVTLAIVHSRTGRFARTTLLVTRALVVGAAVVSALATYSAIWEIRTFDYPWTLPGRPFGTYAQPTALGVGMVAVSGVLFIVAMLAALVHRGAAVAVLALIALTSLPGALMWLSDDTAPPNNTIIALVVGPTFPALTIAALLAALHVPLFGGRGG